MYITPRQYAAAYESILSSARRSSASGTGASSSPILIIPAMDPDAVFATRILTAMLERDCLSYRLSPVAGWKELSRVIQSQRWYRLPPDQHHRMDEDGAEEDEEEEPTEGGTRVVILINVGASTDLSSFLRIPPGVTAHLIDSHRPYALENLFSTADGASPTVLDASSLHQAPPEAQHGRIVVWDDGDVAEDMDAEREAYLALEYEPDSESEADRSDASEDEDERAFQAARRRQRLDSASSGEEDGSSDDDGEEDEDGEPRERQRKKKRRREEEEAEKMLSKREKAKHLARLKKYYSGGTSHGQSVAGIMYVLAEGRALQDNDLLWLAILGLTYQFTASLIDRDRYDTYVVTYQREVARINFTHPTPALASNDDYLPPVQSRALTADGEPGPSGADDRNIRPSDELRFMLFRHWNLYDSMFHSGYVAGKLKLWRERGRRNLQGMLAKMGFSLQQCQQTYAHMDMDLKRTLRRKVDSLAPEYGLFDLCFPSFVRTFGYRSILSASDCVEAVAALLEVANGVRLDFSSPATNGMGGIVGPASGDGIGQGGRFWEGGGKPGGRWKGEAEKENRDPTTTAAAGGASGVQVTSMTQAAKKAAREEEWWVSNFWLAWDALSTDTTLLRSALPLSMALHRSVIRQGTSLLDKQAIKTLRSFRLAVIREGPDLGVFAHPATLTRLGLWLVDAVRDLILGGHPSNPAGGGQGGKRPKSLPFVVASLDEEKDTFWVVGVTGAVEDGDVRKNKFGQAFQAAAELSNARARHDRFEESACEVRKDDLMAFVEKLHLAL